MSKPIHEYRSTTRTARIYPSPTGYLVEYEENDIVRTENYPTELLAEHLAEDWVLEADNGR